MAYPYICDPCKEGVHEHCEKKPPPMPPGPPDECGGGMCVCDHKDIYRSPNEVWTKRHGS